VTSKPLLVSDHVSGRSRQTKGLGILASAREIGSAALGQAIRRAERTTIQRVLR